MMGGDGVNEQEQVEDENIPPWMLVINTKYCVNERKSIQIWCKTLYPRANLWYNGNMDNYGDI